MVVSLSVPLDRTLEFNSDKQTAFCASVASVAGVSVSEVKITVKDENMGKVRSSSVEVRPTSANQVLTHTHTYRGAIHRATDTSSARPDSHY